MSRAREVWESYVESWKVQTIADKQRLFDKCLSPECVYTDPLTVAKGWNELSTYMVGFHGQIPGGHFVTEQFITHHDRSIARWRMVNSEGVKIGEGVSYGEYGTDGKLIAMTGFFEVPAH